MKIFIRSREVQSADAIVLNWEKNAPQSIPSIVPASLGELLDCPAIEFDPSPGPPSRWAVRSAAPRAFGRQRVAVA